MQIRLAVALCTVFIKHFKCLLRKDLLHSVCCYLQIFGTVFFFMLVCM